MKSFETMQLTPDNESGLRSVSSTARRRFRLAALRKSGLAWTESDSGDSSEDDNDKDYGGLKEYEEEFNEASNDKPGTESTTLAIPLHHNTHITADDTAGMSCPGSPDVDTASVFTQTGSNNWNSKPAYGDWRSAPELGVHKGVLRRRNSRNSVSTSDAVANPHRTDAMPPRYPLHHPSTNDDNANKVCDPENLNSPSLTFMDRPSLEECNEPTMRSRNDRFHHQQDQRHDIERSQALSLRYPNGVGYSPIKEDNFLQGPALPHSSSFAYPPPMIPRTPRERNHSLPPLHVPPSPRSRHRFFTQVSPSNGTHQYDPNVRLRSTSFAVLPNTSPLPSTPRTIPASPSRGFSLSALPSAASLLRPPAAIVERPIEEVIPSFETLHFSLLRHTLRRDVAPDEILGRDDCLAVMNARQHAVVLAQEDNALHADNEGGREGSRFLCEMHTTASEQLQQLNAEMTNTRLNVLDHIQQHARKNKHLGSPKKRLMTVSHTLKLGKNQVDAVDFMTMALPKITKNEILLEDTFSTCSPRDRDRSAPAVYATVETKEKTDEPDDILLTPSNFGKGDESPSRKNSPRKANKSPKKMISEAANKAALMTQNALPTWSDVNVVVHMAKNMKGFKRKSPRINTTTAINTMEKAVESIFMSNSPGSPSSLVENDESISADKQTNASIKPIYGPENNLSTNGGQVMNQQPREFEVEHVSEPHTQSDEPSHTPIVGICPSQTWPDCQDETYSQSDRDILFLRSVQSADASFDMKDTELQFNQLNTDLDNSDMPGKNKYQEETVIDIPVPPESNHHPLSIFLLSVSVEDDDQPDSGSIQKNSSIAISNEEQSDSGSQHQSSVGSKDGNSGSHVTTKEPFGSNTLSSGCESSQYNRINLSIHDSGKEDGESKLSTEINSDADQHMPNAALKPTEVLQNDLQTDDQTQLEFKNISQQFVSHQGDDFSSNNSQSKRLRVKEEATPESHDANTISAVEISKLEPNDSPRNTLVLVGKVLRSQSGTNTLDPAPLVYDRNTSATDASQIHQNNSVDGNLSTPLMKGVLYETINPSSTVSYHEDFCVAKKLENTFDLSECEKSDRAIIVEETLIPDESFSSDSSDAELGPGSSKNTLKNGKEPPEILRIHSPSFVDPAIPPVPLVIDYPYNVYDPLDDIPDPVGFAEFPALIEDELKAGIGPHVSEHTTPKKLKVSLADKSDQLGRANSNTADKYSSHGDYKLKTDGDTSINSQPPHLIRRKLLLPDLSEVLSGEDMTDVTFLDNFMYCNNTGDKHDTNQYEESIPPSNQGNAMLRNIEATPLIDGEEYKSEGEEEQEQQHSPSAADRYMLIQSRQVESYQHPFAEPSRQDSLPADESRVQRGGLCDFAPVSVREGSGERDDGEFDIVGTCNSFSHAVEIAFGFFPSEASKEEGKHHRGTSLDQFKEDAIKKSSSNTNRPGVWGLRSALKQCWNDVHETSTAGCDIKNANPCGPSEIYRQASARSKCQVNGKLFTPPTLRLRTDSLMNDSHETASSRSNIWIEHLHRERSQSSLLYRKVDPRWEMAGIGQAAPDSTTSSYRRIAEGKEYINKFVPADGGLTASNARQMYVPTPLSASHYDDPNWSEKQLHQ